MSLFGKKQENMVLDETQERMISDAERLLSEIREKNRKRTNPLIFKLELRDEIQNLEKSIEQFRKQPDEKQKTNLENAVIRLKTVSGHLLSADEDN